MGTIRFYAHELLDILKKAKDEKILVKMFNHSEKWSDHFFQILELKEIRDKDYQVTIVILFDPETSDATALDLKTISGVEFNTQVESGGNRYRMISIRK
jgi:hypothetical protein